MGEPQLGMHAWRAVDRERAVVDLPDQAAEPRVLERARRQRASPPGIETLASDPDGLAEQEIGNSAASSATNRKRITVDRSP
jgi:hypothetical protein